jgi:hypothetical protein
VHLNTSDLVQQSYASNFSGGEFFLEDHRVKGQKVLPAVAYLEMARAAVTLASPARPESSFLELRDTVWLKPIVVAGPKQVFISLFESDEGGRTSEQIDYEIYGRDEDAQGQLLEVLHCQGHAVFSRQPAPAGLDVARLRARMDRGEMTASELYATLTGIGLEYGSSHRGVTAVYLGEDELLAQLRLPTSVAQDGADDFLLHPSLMDSALQASIGLIPGLTRSSRGPYVPFALESLRVISACEGEMYAWVRHSQAASANATGALVKLDIDLCDPHGKICVQMRGFASRVLEGGIASAAQPLTAANPVAAPDAGEEAAASFDDDFYRQLVERVSNKEISVDEAVELGQSR